MTEQAAHVGSDLVIDLIRLARSRPEELGDRLQAPLDADRFARALHPLAAEPSLLYSVTSEPAYPAGTSVGLDLRTANGRWWHIDATVNATSPPLLSALSVRARPPAFVNRPGGLIVCVFGPSSSGKSSLMAALAEHAGTPWTRFDEMFPGKIPIEYLIWRGAAGPMRAGFLAAVAAFARVGNQVTLSAPPDPDVLLAFDGIPTVFVHLVARLEILVARQGARGDRWAGLAEETHAADQGIPGWDLEIDTSDVSVEEAARQLITFLEERGLHGLEEPDLACARPV